MKPLAFATAFREPAGSPIRELFPYLKQPGMISLAGGYPSPALLDIEGLREAAGRVWSLGGESVQYGATEGHPLLRAALVKLSADRGVQAEPADLLVTTGSQQGFDILVRILLEPGSVACVETPAYPATLQALRLAGIRIMQAQCDGAGLDVDALDQALRNAATADRPKILYTVPTFSNPSGATLSLARRRRLVELAREFGFLIVEDDPYGELRFTGDALPTLYEIGSQGGDNPVIYLSSLSKTVAPSLRIGWMVAHADVLRRSTVAKQTMDLCTSPLVQLIAAEYLNSGRYRPTVARASAEYGARLTALTGALDERLRGKVDFDMPAGGMFLWARIAAAVDHRRLFQSAAEEGVLFVPGSAFYAVPPPGGGMRLSHAASDVPAILEGVRRLSVAFERATAP